MRQNDRPGAVVRLDDDQFAQLVELLTPGYTLAKMYLEQHKPEDPPADEPKSEDKPKSEDQST